LIVRNYLAPGERGTVLIVAADRKQSRVVLRAAEDRPGPVGAWSDAV
jgi:hypothetical protein